VYEGGFLSEFTLKKRINISFFILFCRFQLPGLFGILGKCVVWVSFRIYFEETSNVSFFILFCRFRLLGLIGILGKCMGVSFFRNLL
jgi:hypothetical protein